MAAFDLYDAAHRVFRACLLELSEFALARTRHAGARFAPLEPALRAAAEGLIEDCTNQLRNSGIERVRDERDYLADFRREAADLLNGALAAGRQGTVDPRLFAGQGNRTMAVFAWLWPFLRVPLAILIAVLMFYWVLYGV
ncbi:hypothetical protein OCH7691_02306 [Oceanibacterium hippocampi]|uniref:Uncharacterized protein n=2 Tax=Oceanibacterium hippocampi TaxID=745714 RepID=A0A1Y5T2R3_9PROT|nr:hypothetical protein OCH7691_02306 [Oceanibacterium hippocampi]